MSFKNREQKPSSSSPLFKHTKADSAKYAVKDGANFLYRFFATIFNFIAKTFYKIAVALKLKPAIAKINQNVSTTINDKKTRKRFEVATAVLIFLGIFAGSSLVAIAADAPTNPKTASSDSMFIHDVELPTEVILPDIIKDAVKSLIPPPPVAIVDTSTYKNLDPNAFTNNASGIVQWPFLLGVPLSDGFGSREEVCASGCSSTTNHGGQDFGAGDGAQIQAIADGQVVYVENFEANTMGTGDQDHNGGSYVMIRHHIDGQDVVSLYAHLQYKSTPLKIGDTVTRGDLVGLVGNTGMSTASHLHLGIKVNGSYVDPIPFLTKYNAINAG